LPEQRIGAGPYGINEIKNHRFFSDIDWESLASKKIKPPFVPKIESLSDISNIDK